ncbi:MULTISPECIES: DUF397 domain-containing protein [unclassified Streptomyces]|uniref:DUF397 domain-containing protein n=1 Tax=unclassified Streptomyces TaxID=2593676 RepID=UPI000DAB430F|nr:MULTISPECIES: DUF397 domain-containing protein [unclassified Streptomyces]PZT76066.1 DUF397 domain-containing protein [Streptomyces sp. AC1-42W]PZT79983.1 DUF397 domain-containing protein [Streptomyces sp. AC1-42T]
MMHRSSAGTAFELEWFKSSYSSGSEGDSCVEVAAAPGAVHVRDSKDLSVPALAFGQGAWAGFVSYAAER